MSVFADILAGVLKPVTDTVEHLTIDATEKAKIAAALEQARMDIASRADLAQAKINEVEAANPNVFVSGWRPYIGWVCGSGLTLAFIVGPFFTWVSAWIATGKPGPFPVLDVATLFTLVSGMLGLGYLRTEEKKAGVAK